MDLSLGPKFSQMATSKHDLPQNSSFNPASANNNNNYAAPTQDLKNLYEQARLLQVETSNRKLNQASANSMNFALLPGAHLSQSVSAFAPNNNNQVAGQNNKKPATMQLDALYDNLQRDRNQNAIGPITSNNNNNSSNNYLTRQLQLQPQVSFGNKLVNGGQQKHDNNTINNMYKHGNSVVEPRNGYTQNNAIASSMLADMPMDEIQQDLQQIRQHFQTNQAENLLYGATNPSHPNFISNSYPLQSSSSLNNCETLKSLADHEKFTEQLVASGVQSQASKKALTQQKRFKNYQRRVLHACSSKMQLVENSLTVPLIKELQMKLIDKNNSAKTPSSSSLTQQSPSFQDFNPTQHHNQQDSILVENTSLSHELSALKQVERAEQCKPPVDEYNLRYINLLKQSTTCHRPKLYTHFTQGDKNNYSNTLKLFFEGKFLSNSADLALISKKLAHHEHSLQEQPGYTGSDQYVHLLLSRMWELVTDLAKNFHDKPSLTNLLISFKDDRFCLNRNGVKSKSSIETRLATITSKFLEQESAQEIGYTAQSDEDWHNYFDSETCALLQNLNKEYPTHYYRVCEILILDQTRQVYPYFTLLMLFRLGLFQQAVSYANQSGIEEVRLFGTLIQKYAFEFKCKLPVNQIYEFFDIAHGHVPANGGYDNEQVNVPIQQTTPLYDICKEALTHLMTGATFNPQDEEIFFTTILPKLDDQLWFFLKLASAPYQQEINEKVLQSVNDLTVPEGFKPYFIEDLQDFVKQRGKAGLYDPYLSESQNCVNYAKVLFCIGQFNEGLIELIEGDFLVEAAHFGIVLTDMNLVASKTQLLQKIRDQTSDYQTLKNAFPVKQAMAGLYDKCFNFDGSLIGLAFHGATQEKLVTEAIILLLLCQDKKLREVALAHFLHQTKLFYMVLENDERKYLTFELNQGVTLRQYLREDSYRSLVLTLVDIVDKEDTDLRIVLLDKIKNQESVLKVMLEKQAKQNEVQKPMTFTAATIPNVNQKRKTNASAKQLNLAEWKPRVKDQYKSLLDEYHKQKLDLKYKNIWFVLEQGDIVAQAFEILAKNGEQNVQLDDLFMAYNKLASATFFPSASKKSQDDLIKDIEVACRSFMVMESDLQLLSIDVALCVSWLAYYGNQQVNVNSNLKDVLATNSDGKRRHDAMVQEIEKMRLHQALLTEYIAQLNTMQGPHQKICGEQLSQAEQCMRYITINLS